MGQEAKIMLVETARTSDVNTFVKSLLSWYLTSLIFHLSGFCTMMSSRPSYPFSDTPIFQNPKVLESLIPLVTTDPTPNSAILLYLRSKDK